MELFPTRNRVKLIDKKVDGLVSKFEEYTSFITDKFEKLEQSISCVEQQNIENNNKINMVSEQLCYDTENLNTFFAETIANTEKANGKCEIIIEMLTAQEEEMKTVMALLNDKANENQTLIKGLNDKSVKIIENYELVKGAISALKEEIANNNFTLKNKISEDVVSLISVFSDKYNISDKQLREIITSINSNELSLSELKENLTKVYDKTNDGVLISKNIQETISKEIGFNREVACGLKNIEEKVLAIKSLSNDKFNSVEDRQKKISDLCSNVLSNIASVEESTRLLLVNNIINKIPKI